MGPPWNVDSPGEPGEIRTRALEPKTLPEFLPLLAKTLAAPDTGSPMCHYPIHGIRWWAGDQMIFQTSLCWMSGNYHFSYPDGSSAQVGFEAPALPSFIPLGKLRDH